MKNNPSCFLSATLLLLAVSAPADTLTLKNGTVLQGKYLGGTADTLRFETSAGLQIVEFANVRNMSVSPSAPAPAPAIEAPAPAVAPTPASAASVATPATAVTLPAGTLLLVRMMDSVSSRSSDGTSFTTKLEYNLVANGVVAAKAGTVIYGKVQSATQAKRAIGRSTLDIRLAQMVVGGAPVSLATSEYQVAGAESLAKVAKAAGAGAVIGNNSGSGSGSDGALIGVGVALLKPGQTLTIPPGTLLEFTLTQPITVSVGN
jgi:hypothetical protein